MAPEVLENKRSPKGDIWSIGAITYFLLTGKEPLDISSQEAFEADLKKLRTAKEFKLDQ